MLPKAGEPGTSGGADIWVRARIGATRGLRLALYFALLTVVIVPLSNTDRRYAQHPISLAAALLWVLVFVPLGGAIISVARAFVCDIFGAALTGCAVVLPANVAIAISSRGIHGWSLEFAFAVAFLTFLLGSFFGAMAWLTRTRWAEPS